MEKIYERQAHDPLWVIMAIEADTDGIVESIPERHLRALLIELDEEFGKLTLKDLARAYKRPEEDQPTRRIYDLEKTLRDIKYSINHAMDKENKLTFMKIWLKRIEEVI